MRTIPGAFTGQTLFQQKKKKLPLPLPLTETNGMAGKTGKPNIIRCF